MCTIMKKVSILLVFLLMIQIIPIIPSQIVLADDVTASLPFITDIALTDYSDNALEADVEKDADVRVAYSFEIPNDFEKSPGVGLQEGDTVTLTIPNEILIAHGGDFDLVDTVHHQVIATGTLQTNGTIVITFTSYVETFSDISGSFWFDLAFNGPNIGDNEPETISFEVTGTAEPVTVEVDFKQPPPLPTSVQKAASYDSTTKEITWTVTMNKENVIVRDAVLVDIIESGLEFVANSVTVNGASADGANYTYNDTSKTLTYTFPDTDVDPDTNPDPVTSQQVITFKTKVVDSEFTTENAHGTTITKSNSATLNHDGETTPSNEATVNIPVNFIEKTGNFVSSRKQIDWTITINENNISIPDAVVTDTLPEGLTLNITPNAVQVDGVDTVAYTYDVGTRTISYDFGAIAESHTLTFSTEVENDAFLSNTPKTYQNTAVLTGTNVPANAQDTNGTPVQAETSVVSKTGIGYNRVTGEITWRITVNSNQVSIMNPIITDEIPIGQEYVANSATIDNGADIANFSYIAAPVDDTSKTGTLTYTFGITTDKTYVIEYKTKVTDPQVYMGNSNPRYYNTAKLDGKNIPVSTDQGSQRITSEVIDKTGEGYNYITREITWQIKVNENQMALDNVVITDDIPTGMEYVADSATINNGGDAGGFAYVAGGTGKSGTLTYMFSGTINSEYFITFKTKITDLSIFSTNGNKTKSNAATLTHDQVPGGVTDSGSETIKNTVISKTADYSNGNRYIDWSVIINSNNIPLSDLVMTDAIQDGLSLDTLSVKLFHQEIDAAGNLTKRDEITLDGSNITYDFNTNIFTFTIPTNPPNVPTNPGGYLLTFTTNILDKSKSPFSNEIKFNGTGTLQDVESQQYSVGWSGSGSVGVGTVGGIKVIKVDSDNHATRLQGAEFELIDMYGNVVQRKTTDANGESLFEFLRFDVDYTVREVVAPTGYLLNNTPYAFQIPSASADETIEYTHEDDKILGNIQFTKYAEGTTPLQGAIFTLYKAADTSFSNPITTSTSGADGAVAFNTIGYGDYVIRETTPPEGYLLSSDQLTAQIRNHGETVTASPASITNDIIKGDIRVLKTEEDGTTPLQGAELTLYKADDTGFSNPIDAIISDANGIVLFEDIEYGDYVIRETDSPTGYQISSNTLSISVTTNNTTHDAGVFKNEKIYGKIQFTKYGLDSQPLQGAEFTLYSATDTTFSTALATKLSGADGVVLFEDVEYGDYVIKETKPPEGYLPSNDQLTVTISQHDLTVETTPNAMDNEIIRGNIKFTKYGYNSVLLQGAEFTLYKATDTTFSNPVTTSVSGADGIVLFSNIPYGNYVIKETKPPEGYLLSTEELTATISDHQVTVATNHTSITNQIILGNIKVKKTGENKVTPLSGAELTLYKAEDTDFSNPVQSLVSGTDGIVLFENVQYGNYIIKETKAPSDYKKTDETLKVMIREHNKTYDLGVLRNELEYFETTIEVKLKDDNNDPLVGGKFGLYYDNEILIKQAITDVNGVVRFENVPRGVYAVRQLEAADKYELSNQIIMLDVESTEQKSVEFQTKVLGVSLLPATGDAIQYYLYLFLLSAMLIAILYIVDKNMPYNTYIGKRYTSANYIRKRYVNTKYVGKRYKKC